MSKHATLTDEDERKRVVDATGDEVGRLVEVRNGIGYVDPDPSVTDTITSKLGWGDVDEDTYPLEAEHIETVTDGEVRLGY